MIEQTIQAADFQKKPYAMPQMKAYQVKHASIIYQKMSLPDPRKRYFRS